MAEGYAGYTSGSGPPVSLLDQKRRRHAAMKSERATWDPHWRELADNIQPRRSRFLVTDRNRGGGKNGSIVDSTGTQAHRTAAAGLMAGLTSPARPWFRFTTDDPELRDFAPVKLWLTEAERRTRQVFAGSNFYNALHTMYEELLLFGTAAALMLDDFEDIIRMDVFTCGEYCLGLNNRREADALYRETSMTVWQVVQEFGLENCSDHVQGQWRNKVYDSWVNICHAIEPNPGFDVNKRDNRNFAYASCYWEEGSAGQGNAARGPSSAHNFLRQSGFRENALLAPRWDVIGSDVYGRSPGMDALPDVKQLQIMKKREGQFINAMVQPPTQGGGARDKQVSLLPGTHNSGINQVQDRISAIYEPNPSGLTALSNSIAQVEYSVQTAFFADLFRMFTQTRGGQPPTAEQIRVEREEQLLQLGPVLERLDTELLSPIFDRVLAVMARKFTANGEPFLPEPPEEIQGKNLDVEYISVLAQAQKGVATAGVERFSTFVGQIAAVDPAVLDKWDRDQTVDEYGDMLGVPAAMIRSDDQVAALREARAQEEQAAKIASMMPTVQQGASALKDISETDVGGGVSALQAMLGAAAVG